VNRLLAKYAQAGKGAFIHGNTKRKPVHAFSLSHKQAIVSLYNKKYFDANFVHASHLMAQHDGINVSPSALRKILYSLSTCTAQHPQEASAALADKAERCLSKRTA